MKLNGKFSFIILFIVIQALVLTAFSLSNVKRVQNIKDYLNTETKSEAQLSSIIDYLERMDYWDFDLSTAYSDFDVKKTEITESFKYLTENPIINDFHDNFKANLNQIKLTWQLIENDLNPIEDILRSMEKVQLDANMRANIKNYGIRETAALYQNDPAANKLLEMAEEAHQHLRKIRLQYVSLMSLNKKSAVMINEAMEEIEGRFLSLTIVFAIAMTVILSILILFVTTRVSRRVVKMRDITTTLAEKDFTVNIKPEGSDEMTYLMENLNNMVEQVNAFFQLVKSTAKKALDSEAIINSSAGSTAEASALIDTNINHISKVFQEAVAVINSAIGVISEMNVHVDTLVRSNTAQTDAIENSSAAINEVVSTLEYINKMALERVNSAREMHTYVADGDEKITSTNEILNHVAEQLDEVYEVVTIINNVAEQTNLLSMNAAIESAHAGEAGKGFGVVAEEIRSLAEETSENADKISRVVNTIVQAVENANSSSKSAFEAFEKVSSHADQIVNSLQDITGGIGKIDDQMRQIKQRSNETAAAADEMNRYCGELADKQKQVSAKVDNMNDVFITAISGLHKIKSETADIVSKMKNVSASSDESYKNLAELESVLEGFKTSVKLSAPVIEKKAEPVAEKTPAKEENKSNASNKFSSLEPLSLDNEKDEVPALDTELEAPAVEEKKVEVKVKPKAEKKAEVKVEAKPEPKVEAKVETKTEPKVEVKPAPKAETKGEAKIEVKPAPTPAPEEAIQDAPVVEEAPAAPAGKKTYNSPTLAEIDAKLNELAMTGGYGITEEHVKNDALGVDDI